MHGLPKAGVLVVIYRGEGGAPRLINCMRRVAIFVLPKAGVLAATSWGEGGAPHGVFLVGVFFPNPNPQTNTKTNTSPRVSVAQSPTRTEVPHLLSLVGSRV